MFVESLRDGGGLRWAVRSKGSGLYITKRRHLPLVAVREVGNYQNFFPFPLQEDEEEAFELDDNPEDEGHLEDFPEVCRERRFAACCGRVDWEKCSFSEDF